MFYYAGIGSRRTPTKFQTIFYEIGKYLGKKDFCLRSGGAMGADQAFERGCDLVLGNKEIYLPWKNFNASNSGLIVSDPRAFEIAEQFHPNWSNLSSGGRKLQARNSHQILGIDLNNPTNFVVCWTPDGKGSGGTGQALRIAKFYNIPVFDAGAYEHPKDFIIALKHHVKNLLSSL